MADTYIPVLTSERIEQILLSIGDPYQRPGDFARRIEEAAIVEYQRQQWQPIEMAPKDQMLLLGYVSGHGE